MTRMLDANAMFAGSEPKFSPLAEITKVEMAQALNWYSNNKNTKDAQKYAVDYFKKKLKLTNVDSALKDMNTTFCFISRIVINGGVLSEKDQTWFNSQVELVKTNSRKKKKTVSSTVVEKPVVSIQDRIREKSSECIAELEGQIDEMIISEFKTVPIAYGLMHTMAIKQPHTKYILEWCKKRRAEYSEVIDTKDEYLKEAYSNFKKTHLKKLVSYCDQIILDCQKITGIAIKSRKPRARKEKTPDQLVSKVILCKEFKELNIKSIDAKLIIGATQAWVYNTKYKKLGVYHASDASGFGVKGTSITNYDEAKSIKKTLRKPQDVLPGVLTVGKVTLRGVMEKIRATDGVMNGRLNADTILLRVIK